LDKVKFGIIGLGIFGQKRLIPAFATAHNAELVAIYKRDLHSARKKAEEFGIPRAYNNIATLLADKEIDAVFIATPNNLHMPHTLQAAAAGKHILVEKPMALTVIECEQMIAACRRANVKLMIGQSQRFLNVVQRARLIVQSGELGNIIFAQTHYSFHVERSPREWVWDKAVAGGGPVFDLGVHCIDLMRYVLKQEIMGLSSFLSPSGINSNEKVETAAVVAFQFEKDTLGSMQCAYNADFRTFFEFRGQRGTIWAENYTQFDKEIILHKQREDKDEEEAIYNENPYVAEIDAFAAVIRNQQENPVPGEEGLQNQAIIEKILSSSRIMPVTRGSKSNRDPVPQA